MVAVECEQDFLFLNCIARNKVRWYAGPYQAGRPSSCSFLICADPSGTLPQRHPASAVAVQHSSLTGHAAAACLSLPVGAVLCHAKLCRVVLCRAVICAALCNFSNQVNHPSSLALPLLPNEHFPLFWLPACSSFYAATLVEVVDSAKAVDHALLGLLLPALNLGLGPGSAPDFRWA